jgi:hypothetical protein
MLNRRWPLLCAALLTASLCFAQAPPAPVAPTGASSQSKAVPTDASGDWSGTWSSYNPAQAAQPPKEQCKDLSAKVTNQNGVWEAIFEGNCGRPYKYNIKMEGHQAGKVVLFKGSADLGARDGGVFDWVGRATDKEFIGFYTSQYSTGVFSLTRKP